LKIQYLRINPELLTFRWWIRE